MPLKGLRVLRVEDKLVFKTQVTAYSATTTQGDRRGSEEGD